MAEWLVAADDRTGAFEVAACLAVEGAPVTVSTYPVVPARGVVDLGSRALAGDEAASRAADVEERGFAWSAHKIDSTLRGHWLAELQARVAVRPRPVVLLAAWPAMGRTCIGGVVHVDGRATASVVDAVRGVRVLSGPDALERWEPDGHEWAVVDVVAADDLAAAAAIAASHDWLVAGPAGAIGAVGAAVVGSAGSSSAATVPRVDGSVVVACGSATAVSAEQLRRLTSARPEVEVIAAPPATGELTAGPALDVAARVGDRLARGDVGTLVVVGGDTAAAVLGGAERRVGGFAALGMPWSLDASEGGPLVITKAGGFGGPDALVDLLVGR